MNNTFNKYKIQLILYFVIFVVLFTFSVTTIDYTVVAPAYNDDIKDTIIIPSSNNTEGSFHTTSVISLDSMSLIQYLIGTSLLNVDIEKQPTYYDNINESDLKVMDYLMKDDSLQTSLIVGINKAGMNIEYTSYYTVFLTYRHISPNSLQVGDQIVKVNGNEDVLFEMQNSSCHEVTYFDIIRDNKEISVTGSKETIDDDCTYGLYLKPFSTITSTEVGYRLEETNTGGPSGGLMQSLYVYNQLITKDYTYGLKIGGTGTIDINGNVGYIGGVRQKIITAIGNEIDIFFVPHLNDTDNDNYIIAKKTLEELNSDMILVGVATFDEALTYLENYGDSHE